jgi:Protein of unknown function (DUF3311)
MSSRPPTNPSDRSSLRPLGGRLLVVTGVLLLIPMIALAVVPLYTKDAPKLFGFPFFYWYQILWVFLASAFTYTAHRVIKHVRGGQR